MAIDTHSLLLPKCVHLVQRTRRCDQIAVLLQRTAASLCDDGLMAPKMLRLRSSSQMREVNTHGTAGGRAWLRPSVCVRVPWDADRQESNSRNSDSVLQTENFGSRPNNRLTSIVRNTRSYPHRCTPSSCSLMPYVAAPQRTTQC